MSNFIDAGPYIEVYPLDTISGCLYMNAFAATYPVSEDEDWTTLGGDKSIDMWMAEDIGDDNSSDVQQRYDYQENPLGSGGDIVYYDDTPTQVASQHYSSALSGYFANNIFCIWNLNRFSSENFTRAEFVADMSAVNSSLGGPQDDAENTVARFESIPVTSFGNYFWDYRRSFTDGEGGGVKYSFAKIEDGSLNDFYAPSRTVIPLTSVPSGQFGFRISVYMRDGGPPVNNNNISILCDPSAVDGIEYSPTLGGDWHEAILFDMPCIRLWRNTSVEVEPKIDLTLNTSIDATIVADTLFHSARRRRNQIRR